MPLAPMTGGADAGGGDEADDAGAGGEFEPRHGTTSAITTSSTANAGPISRMRFRTDTSLVSG